MQLGVVLKNQIVRDRDSQQSKEQGIVSKSSRNATDRKANMLSNTAEVDSYFLVLCILNVHFAGQENVPCSAVYFQNRSAVSKSDSYYVEHLFFLFLNRKRHGVQFIFKERTIVSDKRVELWW